LERRDLNTPETAEANISRLVSWNGKKAFDQGGDEPQPQQPGNDGLTEDTAFTVAEAITKAKEVGTTKTELEYYVKGLIKGTPNIGISATYNNATFDMVDNLADNESFKAFRIKSFDGGDFTANDPLAEGDEVVVLGKIVNYNNNTPETAEANISRLVSWNGKKAFDQGGQEPAEIQDKTIAEFIRLQDTQNAYRLTATIDELDSYYDATQTQVITFDIKDATGTINVKSLAEGEAFKWVNHLLPGASIVLVGTYDSILIPGNINYTPVVVNATIESCEGGTTPGGTDKYYEKVSTSLNDWSGKYLLVSDTAIKAFSGFSTTATIYGTGADVTIADSGIKSSADVDKYQLVIAPAKVTQGAYTIKFGDTYLSWTSGNSLKGADAESANANWIISLQRADDGSSFVYIANAADETRKIKWNNANPRFAAYTTTQGEVQLYKLAE